MVSDVYCDARTINIEQEVIRRENGKEERRRRRSGKELEKKN